MLPSKVSLLKTIILILGAMNKFRTYNSNMHLTCIQQFHRHFLKWVYNKFVISLRTRTLRIWDICVSFIVSRRDFELDFMTTVTSATLRPSLHRDHLLVLTRFCKQCSREGVYNIQCDLVCAPFKWRSLQLSPVFWVHVSRSVVGVVTVALWFLTC